MSVLPPDARVPVGERVHLIYDRGVRVMLIVSLSCALSAARVQAQGADPSGEAGRTDASDAVAKGLFQAGAAAFDAGQFEEALQHFQEAYARSPRPKLLYNIGQAADRLRKDDIALDAFRRYLAEVPDDPSRDQIAARVRVLEQAVAERDAKAAEEAAAAEQAEPTPAQPAPATAAKREPAPSDQAELFPWAPVLVLGAGVIAIGGGVALGIVAKGEEDDYGKVMVDDAQSAREANALLDDAQGHATLSNVLIGAGAALSAVAAVWLVLELGDDGAPSDEVALAPRLAPGELGLTLVARYGSGP